MLEGTVHDIPSFPTKFYRLTLAHVSVEFVGYSCAAEAGIRPFLLRCFCYLLLKDSAVNVDRYRRNREVLYSPWFCSRVLPPPQVRNHLTEPVIVLVRDMATDGDDPVAKAANLAKRMSKAAFSLALFMAEFGEEFPMIKPVLSTIWTIREMATAAKSNREEPEALEERCTYLTPCLVVKHGQDSTLAKDVSLLEGCIKEVGNFAGRCSRRRKFSRWRNASSDKDEIPSLNTGLDRLTGDLGLEQIATLHGKIDNMTALLVSCSFDPESTISRACLALVCFQKGEGIRQTRP